MPDDFVFPNSMQECKSMIRCYKTQLRNALKEAPKLREEFLNERAKVLARIGDTTTEKIILRIKKAEEVKRVYQKLKQLRGKCNSGGLSRLSVPVKNRADNPKTCVN
jgi:hypothetical protein